MDNPTFAENRAELRVGSIALLLGGAGAFIANLFHPHDVPHQTEALLRLVAATKHWSQLHFLIMLSVVLLVCGLAMLTRNLADPMARALGVLGRYMVILGGAVYLVEIMIDGFATKFFADRWSQAADPAQKAALFTSADAVAHVWFALFPVILCRSSSLATSSIQEGFPSKRRRSHPRSISQAALENVGRSLIQ